ncbi:MAG: isochorismatase family cysteine hydrolase [Bacillota bacterium]|nr:isochorismatase family cysteine hydrolase [Bacillota bacterium]
MKILLVIDMLKDFMDREGVLYCGEDSEKIIPFIKNKIKEFQKDDAPVIYIADNHQEHDKEFEMFPKHCVKGTEGAEILGELLIEDALVVKKSRYSGFFNTNLEELIYKYGKNIEVHVVGVCTNICVMYTVEELRNRDIDTYVYKDGVASFDIKAHEFALKQMESVLGAKVV